MANKNRQRRRNNQLDVTNIPAVYRWFRHITLGRSNATEHFLSRCRSENKESNSSISFRFSTLFCLLTSCACSPTSFPLLPSPLSSFQFNQLLTLMTHCCRCLVANLKENLFGFSDFDMLRLPFGALSLHLYAVFPLPTIFHD